ncbi:hypothetical protein CLF_107689, partial [Clonorchis sinensis]
MFYYYENVKQNLNCGHTATLRRLKQLYEKQNTQIGCSASRSTKRFDSLPEITAVRIRCARAQVLHLVLIRQGYTKRVKSPKRSKTHVEGTQMTRLLKSGSLLHAHWHAISLLVHISNQSDFATEQPGPLTNQVVLQDNWCNRNSTNTIDPLVVQVSCRSAQTIKTYNPRTGQTGSSISANDDIEVFVSSVRTSFGFTNPDTLNRESFATHCEEVKFAERDRRDERIDNAWTLTASPTLPIPFDVLRYGLRLLAVHFSDFASGISGGLECNAHDVVGSSAKTCISVSVPQERHTTKATEHDTVNKPEIKVPAIHYKISEGDYWTVRKRCAKDFHRIIYNQTGVKHLPNREADLFGLFNIVDMLVWSGSTKDSSSAYSISGCRLP